MIFRFEGNMRGGKTLGMTIWGIFFSTITKQPIFSNYHLQGIDYTYFQRWRELEKIKNAIILYDEFATQLDSRKWDNPDNIAFTHLFAQMGKLGLTFMYTAQREHTIEKRVRDQTDYVIKCIKDWKENLMSQTWFDTQKSPYMPIHLTTMTLNKPEIFYKYYDTYEVIKDND